jgi:hypothetical protein
MQVSDLLIDLFDSILSFFPWGSDDSKSNEDKPSSNKPSSNEDASNQGAPKNEKG